MLKIPTYRDSLVFYPCDLKLLGEVLDEICREDGLRRASEEGRHIADELIRSFQHGIVEPEMLKISIRSRRAPWQGV